MHALGVSAAYLTQAECMPDSLLVAEAGKRIAGIVRATPGTKPGITDVDL